MSLHLFALYVPDLSRYLKHADSNNRCVVKNAELSNRIRRILRLKADESSIFFDDQVHITVTFSKANSGAASQVFFTFDKIIKNQPLTPTIVLVLGLVKRPALEKIVDVATQLGVNEIQLLKTEKVQRSWGGGKERERLQRIMIAAAEQSKQFVIPQIHDPITIKAFLNQTKDSSCLVCFEQVGGVLLPLLENVSKQKVEKMFIVLGPEGGLVKEEIEQLKKGGFGIYRLTPTTLRSVQAVSVGVGCIRSVAMGSVATFSPNKAEI